MTEFIEDFYKLVEKADLRNLSEEEVVKYIRNLVAATQMDSELVDEIMQWTTL